MYVHITYISIITHLHYKHCSILTLTYIDVDKIKAIAYYFISQDQLMNVGQREGRGRVS